MANQAFAVEEIKQPLMKYIGPAPNYVTAKGGVKMRIPGIASISAILGITLNDSTPILLAQGLLDNKPHAISALATAGAGAAIAVTATDHGLGLVVVAAKVVTLSGFSGVNAALNTSHIPTIVDKDTFTIPVAWGTHATATGVFKVCEENQFVEFITAVTAEEGTTDLRTKSQVVYFFPGVTQETH